MSKALVKHELNAQIAEADEQEGQFLTFHLAKELFALEIMKVKEIIEYGQVTSVPMMPEFIRGVINLRGSVVPVLDLNARFGRPAREVGKRTCIVIVEMGDEEVSQDIGVVVDSVSEVIGIHADDIEPTPSFGTRVRPEFISGMGKINEQFVIILNAERVLSVDEMAGLVSQLNDDNE